MLEGYQREIPQGAIYGKKLSPIVRAKKKYGEEP